MIHKLEVELHRVAWGNLLWQ